MDHFKTQAQAAVFAMEKQAWLFFAVLWDSGLGHSPQPRDMNRLEHANMFQPSKLHIPGL